jgi:hypothetical protein
VFPQNGARAGPASAATAPAIERLPDQLDPKDRLPGDTAPARDERETHAAPDRASQDQTSERAIGSAPP